MPSDIYVSFPWSPEDDDALRRLFSEGLSASQVAMRRSDELNQPGRFSKNMVMGRCWRRGIPLPRSRRPWLSAQPTHDPFPARGCCLWPYGNPDEANFRCCGQAVAPGRIYCPEHAGRAYVHRDRWERENLA